MATNIEEKCPLCLETLELDDLNFYPCKCGYQVCRFCWHRIRTNENCLCPACRRQYPEDPVTFKPLTQEELQKVKNEKKMKEMQKKKEIAESRKLLANIRVVQKNLVYVHGLPLGIDADEDRYRKIIQVFKEYGIVSKCIINNRTNYAGSQSPRASAYVTYQKIDDALRAFKSLPNTKIEGLEVRTSLGTTKYCSNFLKNTHCHKQDCMYLHEIADEELCFTKEQIHASDHLKCGEMLYDRMVAHLQQRANHQISQLKEIIVNEQQEIELEKSSLEKIDIKDDSSENSNECNISPVQSKLQHLFTDREPRSSVFGSDFDSRFSNPFNSNIPSESSRNGDPHVQLNLSSEGAIEMTTIHTTVNNTHNNIKNYQNFPPQISQDSHNGDLWHEHRSGQPSNHQNHHVHQNGLPNDFSLSSSGNTTSSIVSRLPLYNSNGTSNSSFESGFEQYDDDLGFDPCQVSLNGLEDLINSEAKDTARVHRDHKMLLIEQQRRVALQNAQAMRLKQQIQQNLQLQKQKQNPPPGFSANNFSSNQSLPSPVYESRNSLPNRMAPVINVSNSYNGMRPNYSMQRFQQGGIPLNTNNSMPNGFSPQPLRSFPQQQQPPTLQQQQQPPTLQQQQQPPTLHDLMPRSMMNAQQMQSQRFDNLSQPQFSTVDQNNLSPSFFNNVNHSQWMSAENCFQNQGMTDFRPASPVLNMRRMPQIRPNDVNRQVQQLTARYNNLSPFSDNPQYLFPNNQHNQLTKGVHTFP